MGATAQAKLAPTLGTGPGIGAAAIASSSEATMRATPAEPARGAISANSSPPRRARQSSPRTTLPQAAATDCSTASPTGWPWRSLIALNSSKSNRISAAPSPVASALECGVEAAAVVQVGQRVALGHHALVLLGAHQAAL